MYYRPGSPAHGLRASLCAAPDGFVSNVSGSLLRDRRLVAQNTFFSIYFDHLRYPNGHEVFDYLSILPRTLTADGLSGVSVLPEVNGKICLLRMTRHPLGTTCWEAPRGFIDPQESPVAAAQRELKEETGLDATAARLIPLGILAPAPGVLAARLQLFAAMDCLDNSKPEGCDPGHHEFRFFSLMEIEQLVKNNKIQDPCTLVSYYRYRRIKEK